MKFRRVGFAGTRVMYTLPKPKSYSIFPCPTPDFSGAGYSTRHLSHQNAEATSAIAALLVRTGIRGIAHWARARLGSWQEVARGAWPRRVHWRRLSAMAGSPDLLLVLVSAQGGVQDGLNMKPRLQQHCNTTLLAKGL